MSRSRAWSSTSRRLAILLLAVVLPPAVTLIWLGAQLLEQDRDVIARREEARRTVVGHAVAAEMQRSLAAADHLIEGGPVPDGLARLVVSDDRLEVVPATRLLWTPAPLRLRPAEEGLFEQPTRLEYQGELAGALAVYTRMAESPDRAVRAGALRRIARVYRRQQRWDEALAAYRKLMEFRDISDLGMPSDLLARRNLGDVLQAAGRGDELAREASRLEQDLLGAAWSLDRAAWELTVEDLEEWRGTPVAVPADRRLISQLADVLWLEYRSGAVTTDAIPRVVDVDGAAVTVLARRSDTGLTAVAVAPAALEQWSARAVAGAFTDDARLAIVGTSGQLLAGARAQSGVPTVRLNPSDTALPWTLILYSDQWSRAGEQFEYRRRLLSVGLASILLFLGGGSYFLWRVVRRELMVSRLQTDFVSAVSHEFRTPLTSLRHITELLEENDNMPAERRRSFYEVYRRNTERLHQLVESLLDFARMEAGRKVYDQQPIDAVAFATHVVAEFQRHVGPRSSPIELDAGAAHGLQLRGDRDALANALWNLLDNAVKYSPEQGSIQVRVTPHAAGAAIEVRDSGLGIARHEREAIFQRFVRGRQAVALGIKGTGLGLAMVAHIARAHGGDIIVDSEEGIGSTFRIVLPVLSARAAAATRYEPA